MHHLPVCGWGSHSVPHQNSLEGAEERRDVRGPEDESKAHCRPTVSGTSLGLGQYMYRCKGWDERGESTRYLS